MLKQKIMVHVLQNMFQMFLRFTFIGSDHFSLTLMHLRRNHDYVFSVTVVHVSKITNHKAAKLFLLTTAQYQNNIPNEKVKIAITQCDGPQIPCTSLNPKKCLNSPKPFFKSVLKKTLLTKKVCSNVTPGNLIIQGLDIKNICAVF